LPRSSAPSMTLCPEAARALEGLSRTRFRYRTEFALSQLVERAGQSRRESHAHWRHRLQYRDDVERVGGNIAPRHVIEALGRAERTVECDARRLISMNAARFCCNAAFNERLKVRLVDGDAAPTNEAPSPPHEPARAQSGHASAAASACRRAGQSCGTDDHGIRTLKFISLARESPANSQKEMWSQPAPGDA
jgi:hypothetical protein